MTRRAVYDVLIAGGGPAGAAAALTLARAGASVLLVEPLGASMPAFKVGESLPPAARPLLRDLGVLDAHAAAGHLSSPGNLAAWGGPAPTARDFIRDVNGPGWHLDRPRFDADLRAAASGAGARIFAGRLAAAPGRAGDVWTAHVRGRDGATSSVTARWILDATGRRALVAAGLGAEARPLDRVTAFGVRLSPWAPGGAGEDGDARALVEAAPEGWWYSARLPDGGRVILFFTDADLPAAADARGAAGFRRRLAGTRHLAVWTERVVGGIRRFPAATVARTRAGGEGWLALGDASLALDPISSQGIFHALYTGLRGAQTVLAADGGQAGALAAWEERLRAIGDAARGHLAQCYAAEPRWPLEVFWARRRAS